MWAKTKRLKLFGLSIIKIHLGIELPHSWKFDIKNIQKCINNYSSKSIRYGVNADIFWNSGATLLKN